MRPLPTILATLLLASVAGAGTAADATYAPGPDAQRVAGVPQGTVTAGTWHSTVFPDTMRQYWVYVPKQYDGSAPAAVMVFQDGHAYLDEHGDFRAPIVFDNLIQQGAMPVTVGIFLNPGQNGGKLPEKPGWGGGNNRSFEYDTLSDQYARFLVDEILPEVGKTVKLTADARNRAICGISSGGICAFTVAWQRPEVFSKVLSHVGSFTDIASGKTRIEGGHNYPSLIRKAKQFDHLVKPIRVFLQDGEKDLDNEHGNWFLANQEMAAALKWAGYDYKSEWGTEGHNGKHGGAIMPDSLRWLWRDWKDAAGK